MSNLLDQAIAEIRALPEEEREAAAARILDELKQQAPRRGKWAEVADELATLSPFQGQSGDIERHVREFRDGFRFRTAHYPAGDHRLG